MAILAGDSRQHSPGEESEDQRRPRWVPIEYWCEAEHRERVNQLCRRRGIDQSTIVRVLMKKALDREELGKRFADPT